MFFSAFSVALFSFLALSFLLPRRPLRGGGSKTNSVPPAPTVTTYLTLNLMVCSDLFPDPVPPRSAAPFLSPPRSLYLSPCHALPHLVPLSFKHHCSSPSISPLPPPTSFLFRSSTIASHSSPSASSPNSVILTLFTVPQPPSPQPHVSFN